MAAYTSIQFVDKNQNRMKVEKTRLWNKEETEVSFECEDNGGMRFVYTFDDYDEVKKLINHLQEIVEKK